jgi:hypothetical protein
MQGQLKFIALTVAIAVAAVLVSVPASAKTTKACDDEYAANKAAIQAAKEKKADFIAACKATAEGQTTPIGAAAGAAAAPAPATPAPAAPAATPPASGKAASTGAAGANEFTTEAQAKAKCSTGTVVWVNHKSKIYHFAGNPDYGTTKQGAYMCEADATAAGNRAAKNEKHP